MLEFLHQPGIQVHFIGMGGISMSGLAHILLGRGFKVSGSDWNDSPLIEALRKQGAVCHIGPHKAENIEGAQAVVYTAAAAADNPELLAAKAKGLPVVERARLLGELMSEYPLAYAVCGTHGKTTTTSMLTTILELCGQNPTAHIGSTLPLIGGATKAGSDKIFVAEACEYKESFLLMLPTVELVLNIDADHLDYYRDIDHIQSAFSAFADKLPGDGLLIVNGEDERCVQVAQASGRRFVRFGMDSSNDYHTENVSYDDAGNFSFDLMHNGQKLTRVELSVPGRHNVFNALAALAAVLETTDVDPIKAAATLSEYRGAGRRFELEGWFKGARVYHDYAHHPREIEAALSAARLVTKGRLISIFQPHTYSRTKALFDAFAASLSAADLSIVLDIYAAREADPGDINSKMLQQAIEKQGTASLYAQEFSAVSSLIDSVCEGDTIMIMGAGSVEALAKSLPDKKC